MWPSTCCTGSGATPGSRWTTCRTSPTSTTRCWSGPETGRRLADLAEQQTQLYREDMAALNVLPPEHFVGAVESIPQVVELIAKLQDRGAVYAVEDPEFPDLYFAQDSDAEFGSLGRLSEAEALRLFAERGGDPDRPGKKAPLDCLVWRLARDGEPSWESPSGAGRPGWHIECTAIALDLLGTDFDVQGGRQRPDLPAPRDVGRRGPGGDRPAVRPGVRAQRDGRPGRGEDVEVARQPGLRVDAARVRRRPDGHPARAARAPLPRRLGVERRRADRGRGAAEPVARGGPAGHRRSTPTRCWCRCGPRSPWTSTHPPRWPRSTPGPAPRPAIDSDDTEAPALVARACEALLGVTLLTRESRLNLTMLRRSGARLASSTSSRLKERCVRLPHGLLRGKRKDHAA